MSTNRKQILERAFARLRSQINVAEIERLAGQLNTNIVMSRATRTAQHLGERTPGFRTLATDIDDIVDQVEGSFPQQTVGQFGIVQLTDSSPQIGQTMRQNGSLDVVIAAPQAEAVTAAASELTKAEVHETATPSQLEEIANEVVDVTRSIIEDVEGLVSAVEGVIDDFEQFKSELEGALRGVIGDIIGTTVGTLNKLVDDLNTQIVSDINKVINSVNNGFNSFLKNISEEEFNIVRSQLNTITRIAGILQEVSESDLREIVIALERNDIPAAVSIVQGFSDLLEDDLFNVLSDIDSSISNQLRDDLPTGSPVVQRSIVNTNDPTFQIIHNRNALISEFESLNREATVIVLTHTGSYNDQHLIAEHIDFHARPNGGIPYHYIIRRDGRVERGKAPELPATTLTDHPQYNERSLLVALVGGINSPRPLQNQSPDYSGASASYTRAQWNSLRIFVNAAYTAYPGMQIVGRNNFGDNRTQPGFDVESYIQSIASKQNIINPQLHIAPTRLQIRQNQLVEQGSNAPIATPSPNIGPSN